VNKHRDATTTSRTSHELNHVVHNECPRWDQPYTAHPHPASPTEQGSNSLVNNFHSPYYYCCYLSNVFSLQEDPGETPPPRSLDRFPGSLGAGSDSLSRCRL